MNQDIQAARSSATGRNQDWNFGGNWNLRICLFWVGILTLYPAGIGLAIQSDDQANPSIATVTADVSKSDVQVAEPFTFQLTVQAPAGTRVTLPTIGKQLGDFEVREKRVVPDLPATDSTKGRAWSLDVTLESLLSGEREIPALEVQVSNESGSTTIHSPAVPVRVISVLEGRADPTKFREIQSVMDVNLPQPRSKAWLYWSLGGLGCLALSAIVAILAVRVRRKPRLTPHQWATRELEALQRSEAIQVKNSETITRELSWILRDFLDLQFQLSSPNQTSGELLEAVQIRELLPPDPIQRFSQLFAVADESKFAGLSLTQSELNKMIDEAKAVINAASQFVPADSSGELLNRQPVFSTEKQSLIVGAVAGTKNQKPAKEST